MIQVEYSWRTEEYPQQHFDNRTHLGFVAQEVEKILPNLVGTDKEGWKSIRSTQIIAVLVEAVKELSIGLRELSAQHTLASIA